ncbi:WD40 repeat domain-containing protein [Nonomuraea thailandensis]
MWNLNTGKLIGKPWWGHCSTVMEIEVTKSADGKPIFVTGSTDSRMRIWSLDTRRPIGKPFNTCFTCMVYGIAIGARSDGQRIVISAEIPYFPLDEGSPPATLRIWSLESGRPLGEALTHEGDAHHPVVVTAKDGDGTPVIISGGDDRNVVARNLDSGRPLAAPSPATPATSALWPWAPARTAPRRRLRQSRRHDPDVEPRLSTPTPHEPPSPVHLTWPDREISAQT